MEWEVLFGMKIVLGKISLKENGKKIKELEREKCIPFANKILYNGYIRSDKFESFRKRNLTV